MGAMMSQSMVGPGLESHGGHYSSAPENGIEEIEHDETGYSHEVASHDNGRTRLMDVQNHHVNGNLTMSHFKNPRCNDSMLISDELAAKNR